MTDPFATAQYRFDSIPASRRLTLCSLLATLLVVGVARPGPIEAQAKSAAGDTAKSGPLAKRGEPLFTVRNALVGGGFAVVTVLLFPVDTRIAKSLQDSSRQTNRFLHHAATGLELITSPGAYVIGGGMYVVGRLGHFERLADLGWHGTEAVLVSDITTGLLKGITGRSRPYVFGDTNAHDFHLGRGFTHSGTNSSFPSGHTTTAFAAAAVVTSETSGWWPGSAWFVAPLMYGGATLVGFSRMYHNKHWASDVALGAAIGTFSGLKTVQYTHANPKNRLDRFLLGTAVGPDGRGGLAVAWTIPTH